ncbi:hypothetical protein, partial [Paracoccus gahaiensis]|uniref:hypothetical protein n=1 Tax=Paracoccus gahaiensis TaxID=1706839 RepID=UPI003CCC5452
LWQASNAAQFLPIEMTAAPEISAEPGGASAEITVVLRNGRQLRCPDVIGDAALLRLVRLLETA